MSTTTSPTNKATFYEILQVKTNANVDEIKASYKLLAKKWHPDKNIENKQFATEQFKLIVQAYETLSNSEKRHRYDLTLLVSPPPPPPTPTQTSSSSTRQHTSAFPHDEFNQFFSSTTNTRYSKTTSSSTTQQSSSSFSSEHIFQSFFGNSSFSSYHTSRFDNKRKRTTGNDDNDEYMPDHLDSSTFQYSADAKNEQSFRRTFKTWLSRYASEYESRTTATDIQWTYSHNFASAASQHFVNNSSRDRVLLVMNELFSRPGWKIVAYQLNVSGLGTHATGLQIGFKML